jgi:hypothetical protein
MLHCLNIDSKFKCYLLLFVNLAPLGGIISTYSLTQNQQLILDWNDSIIWNGYVGRFLNFSELDLTLQHLLAV